jgi:Short C-terminal domain
MQPHNKLDESGSPICPVCSTSIRAGQGAARPDDWVVHHATCWDRDKFGERPRGPSFKAPKETIEAQWAQIPSAKSIPYLDELERLGVLHEKGLLTKEEFEVRKRDILQRVH